MFRGGANVYFPDMDMRTQGEPRERICRQCGRVCFSEEQYANHECFDITAKLDAEIALANWDGSLYGEAKEKTANG